MPGEELDAPPQLGDYRLEELLSEGRLTRTYRAGQVSVRRDVVLEILRPEACADQAVVRSFFADVRAKAAGDHTGIGSIYEAVHHRESAYYTREWLAGRSFEELHHAGETFSPRRTVHLLRQISEAMEYLEQRRFATLRIEPRHLVLGTHDVLRLVNLAVAGEPDPAVASHDRLVLAELFLDLLQRGAPGATRTTTLLSLMADEEGGVLTWLQIAHTTRKLEKDLAEGAMAASQPLAPALAGPGRQKSAKRGLFALLVALVIVAALGIAGFLLTGTRPKLEPPPSQDLAKMARIPAGVYRTLNGKSLELKDFWIDAHEVTLAEYAEFLEALNLLPDDRRRAYDHPDQPATKPDHQPHDWESIWTAARAGGTWEGLPLSRDCPVVNIDWWDAHAYANWKGGRLPTQEEWFAASQDAEPGFSTWGPVEASREDTTPRGIHGLGGNVSEWVRDRSKNPAYPMNPKKPLCCGASYLNPRNGVRARTWLDSRSIRRRDLGFRIARDSGS